MPRLLVNVDVPDLAAAATFYGQAFGFAPGRRFAGVVELLGGEIPLYLIARPERDYARHWTPVHLDIVVDDLDAASARALAAGALPEGGVRQAGYGRIATFADPFGHGFCLIEFTAEGYDAIAD